MTTNTFTEEIFVFSGQKWIPINTIFTSNVPQIVKNGNNYIRTYIEQNCGLGEENAFELFFFTKNENMKIKALKCLQYRRCKVFLFSQLCSGTNKTRFLAYGINHMYHSAQSFGTSLELVSANDLMEALKPFVLLPSIEVAYFLQ
jgi:hypothetical protein